MTRPLHIVHVSQPTNAGVAVCVRAIAAHQRSAGHTVTVVCPDEHDLPRWCAEDGVPTVAWAAGRAPGPGVLGETARLRAVLDDLAPDALHLHSSKAGMAGRLAARRRWPTIVHPNGWSFLPPGPQQRAARAWERFAARWTDLFIMAGDDELALALDNRIPGVFAVIPNGVDTDRFSPVDAHVQSEARTTLGLADRPTAVCIGRLCHQKGQDLLLEAWSLVASAVPDAQLLLVGAGEDEATLRAAAPASVVFAGNQTDVRPWLAAADVAVQASRWEGLSFATLEAMASARPVVAFEAPGMRQAIGDAGAVVALGDTEALGHQVARRLGDLDLARDEGVRGVDRVRDRFSARVFCEAVTTVTEELLAGRPARQGIR